MCPCVCLPQRGKSGSPRWRRLVGGAPVPAGRGLFTWCPAAAGQGTPPTLPRLAAASGTLRVAWGSSVLDGGGVRTGETVWVGEDVRGTSQVWVSEHDPRRVASECGPGVG